MEFIHDLPCTTDFMREMALDCCEAQLRLCDSLETLADGLPNSLCEIESRRLLQRLHCCLDFFHQFEEEMVFPSLMNSFPRDEKLKASLKRLSGEHLADRDYVMELVNKLDMLGIRPQQSEVETLAYMLRGIFESLRRHVAFEQEYLISRLVPVAANSESKKTDSSHRSEPQSPPFLVR